MKYRPFPAELLPEPMRAMATATARATGTDPTYAALACLVTAAGCIGNRAAAIVKHGWAEPAVLWGGLVGRSGTLKSPVLRHVTRAVVEIYKADRAEYQAAVAEHAAAAQRYTVELAEWKRQQKGKSAPATDPPVEPEAPREKRLLVSDITVEKLGALLQANPAGLLLVRDELGAWAGAFDRYAAGGKGSDLPSYLSMYDAAAVVIDRKSEPVPLFIERAAVSVLGGIQPGTLARIFGAAEREAGLLARLLLVAPPERIEPWTDDGLPDDVAERWAYLLVALLAMPAGADANGNIRPHFIPLAPDAKERFIRWHDEHRRETAALLDPDLHAAYAKLKGACIRLALIFQCVRCVTAGESVRFIDTDSIERAIGITDWLKNESGRVYGLLARDAETRRLKELVSYIERRGGAATARDLMRGGPCYKTVAAAEAALHELAAAGFGVWEAPADGDAGGNGRPALARFRLAAPPAGIDNTPEFPEKNELLSVSVDEPIEENNGYYHEY